MNSTPVELASRLPTLTDEVDMSRPMAVAALAPAEPQPVPIDPDELNRCVLADVQLAVDSMLEQRVRDALAPMLARLADTLIAEARDEIAATLRDLIAQAVTQELARREPR